MPERDVKPKQDLNIFTSTLPAAPGAPAIRRSEPPFGGFRTPGYPCGSGASRDWQAARSIRSDRLLPHLGRSRHGSIHRTAADPANAAMSQRPAVSLGPAGTHFLDDRDSQGVRPRGWRFAASHQSDGVAPIPDIQSPALAKKECIGQAPRHCATLLSVGYTLPSTITSRNTGSRAANASR